ncbi:hypothetical protein HPP92_027674 [Vanilla planifolia]|nr:hypothetical protein HPP92_027674 [Vanilla planifolia]
MDCSVDLKLGGLGDFGLADKWKEHSRASALPPAAASLAKRPRMPGGGSQNVSCLVDGCRSDLSNCREYHRRHKVCEVHSKTPIVLVGDQEQRFCQQCSRHRVYILPTNISSLGRHDLDLHWCWCGRYTLRAKPLSMHFLDRVQPFSAQWASKKASNSPFLHSSEGMAIGCRTTVEQLLCASHS